MVNVAVQRHWEGIKSHSTVDYRARLLSIAAEIAIEEPKTHVLAPSTHQWCLLANFSEKGTCDHIAGNIKNLKL